jgi:hypothetical protein
VVTHETTVAQREVLAGAALIGAAAALAAGAVARLQSALAARRSFRLACHADGVVAAAAAPRAPARPADDADGGVGGSLAAFSAASSASSASAAASGEAFTAAAQAAAAAVRVVVLHRRAVAKGGVAGLRAHVVSGGASGASAAAAPQPLGELMVWRAARGAWEPLLDTATLPHCASLRIGAA